MQFKSENQTVSVHAAIRVVENERLEIIKEVFKEEIILSWDQFKAIQSSPLAFLNFLNQFLQTSPILVSDSNYDPFSPHWCNFNVTNTFMTTYLIEISLAKELFEQLQKAKNEDYYCYAKTLPQGIQLESKQIKQMNLRSLRMEYSVSAVAALPNDLKEDALFVTWDEKNNWYYYPPNRKQPILIDLNKLLEEYVGLFSTYNLLSYNVFSPTLTNLSQRLDIIKKSAYRHNGRRELFSCDRIYNLLAEAILNLAAAQGYIPKDLGINYHFPKAIELYPQHIDKAVVLYVGFQDQGSNFSLLPIELIKHIFNFFDEPFSPNLVFPALIQSYKLLANFTQNHQMTLPTMVEIIDYAKTLTPEGIVINFSSEKEAKLVFSDLPKGCETFCELTRDQILIKNSTEAGKNGVYIASLGEIAICLTDKLMRDAFAKVLNLVHEGGKIYLNDKPKNPKSQDQSNKIFIKDPNVFTNNKEVRCIMELFSFYKGLERQPGSNSVLKSALLTLIDILKGRTDIQLDVNQISSLSQDNSAVASLLHKHAVVLQNILGLKENKSPSDREICIVS